MGLIQDLIFSFHIIFDVFKFLFSERTLFYYSIFPLPQNRATRSAYTWYQVIISSAAIKDHIGNNLIATYTLPIQNRA